MAMADNENRLSHRIRQVLKHAQRKPAHHKRHPLRNSEQYQGIKSNAAEELDALYERIVQEIRGDIAAIDTTVGEIAEPMADKLAKGAVADMFEAAAEALKQEIRAGHEATSNEDQG